MIFGEVSCVVVVPAMKASMGTLYPLDALFLVPVTTILIVCDPEPSPEKVSTDGVFVAL